MPCSYELPAISSSRDEEMSSGIEEMEAELNEGGMLECRIFSMALRKFRNPCEISLCTVFRYDSEISLS